MNQKLIDKILNCPRLPSLPTVAVEVIDLCRQDNVYIKEIAKVISSDPALSGKILKTVNSSYYGLSTSVSTISHALVILGLNSVKTLALSFSLISTFRDATGEEMDPMPFWRRTLYAAVGARCVAQRCRMPEHEEVFLCGLLQDLGIMAMVHELGAPYVSLLRQAGEHHEKLAALERAEYDLDHAVVAAAMAERWNLPPILVEPIRFHENPDAAPKAVRPVVRAVAMGNLIAPVFVCGDPAAARQRYVAAARQWYGFDEAACDALLVDCKDSGHQMARFFNISTQGCNKLGDIIIEANEVLQEVTLQAEMDKSRLERENHELQQRVTRDALTGVANRGHFNVMLKMQFEHAARQVQPISLILMDADHFKKVNDGYGHLVGDAVLVALAQSLTRHTPERGTVARYGGEEFAVILPGMPRRDAAVLAETLRQGIESLAIETDGGSKLHVTASIGVATFDGAGFFQQPDQLVKAADRAVYAAKAAGRNCVRVFCPKPAAPTATEPQPPSPPDTEHAPAAAD